MSSTRETVQQFLQSVGAHDVDAILDVFGDEVDWVVPGTPSLPWIGRPTTKSQVAEYFPTMWSHFNLDESEVMIEAIVAPAPTLSLSDASVSRSRQAADGSRPTSRCNLKVEDGKIVKMHLYEDTLLIAEAFA